MKERSGGPAAPAVALRDLEAADPLRTVHVEVRDVLVPGLNRRLEHRVDERLQRAAVGAGGRPAHPRGRPPAPSRSPLAPGSPLTRPASTPPADPAPTIT